MQRQFFFLLALLGSIKSQIAKADCIDLTSGRIEYQVTGCEVINPEALFLTPESRDRFFKEHSPQQAKDILDSYRGIILEGKVVSSKAVAKGIKVRREALLGEQPSMFVSASNASKCAALIGKRMPGVVQQNCCDGHLEVPCLTKTSYVFSFDSHISRGAPRNKKTPIKNLIKGNPQK